MSNNRSNDDMVAIAVAVGAGIFAIVVWKFSDTLGLDFKTGLEVFLKILVVAGVTVGCAVWADDTPVSISRVWPVLLCAGFWAFWPALDYWAISPGDRISLATGYELQGLGSNPWWDAWWFKGVIVGVLVGGGYWMRRVLDPYR